MYTGFERKTLKGQVDYGWTAAINTVTTSGATVTLNTLIDFNYIKLKYVATQGDHLQVYYLERRNSNPAGSPPNFYGVSFDYPALVEFDSSRLPNQVFLAIQIAGYLFVNDGTLKNIVIAPAKNLGGGYEYSVSPIPYSQLYGDSKSFTTNGLFMLYDSSAIPFVMQFTLLVHRINLPSETPPDTGIKYSGQIRVFKGTLTVNAFDASINNLSVGTGQVLLGLLGNVNFFMNEVSAAATCSQNLDFTSSAAVTSTTVAFSPGFDVLVAAFYLVNCSPNCKTCTGMLESQCLTCAGDLTAFNGRCTCPSHNFDSSNTTHFLCSACHITCESCSGGLPNQCLTCAGGLTAFNGQCTCPSNAFTSSNITHFLCEACPVGCASCSSALVCTACNQLLYRVKTPDSSNQCPCIRGAYENQDKRCVRCPLSLHCATCSLSGNSIVCLSCSCS